MYSTNRALTLRIKKSTLSELILFLYLTTAAFRIVFAKLLSPLGLDFDTKYICIGLTMALYFLLCTKERKLLVRDFWMLYFVVVLFFLATYLLHPEYKLWYERADYGVLNYVLRPDNGIFLYLFIRLVNDPQRIMKTVKISAWPMYLYYGYQIMLAMQQGYWVNTSNRGYEIHMSYNLSLGYNLLLFVLPFLYDALEKRKKGDFFGAFVGCALILVAGSRGPFLDIGIFFIVYILLKIGDSRQKAVMLFFAVVGAVLLWVFFPTLMSGLASLLEQFGFSSRTVTKFLTGEMLDDSNRLPIWNAALEMIRKNPFGYGAMGSRHVIAQYIYVAHPHQFFLEVLVDFGVIIGSVIIFWLGYKTVKLFMMKGQDEWKGVFLIFFARACQLLVSLTFWHSIGLWGALAVGVCMSKAKRRGIENERQQNQ